MTDGPVMLPTVRALRDQVQVWREDGLSIALVPTMGALHDGHMALVDAALATCDRVVVSIFVNPTQFGADEDFDSYPRTMDADRAKLADAGAHALYAPNIAEMYPAGSMTEIRVTHFETQLEGLHRPGHFVGVATVVTKLLGQAQADHAFFGEKDYQQLLVIKRVATDLCVPTVIHGVATVREADGLAQSSRNAYLNDLERHRAPKLHETLVRVAMQFREGFDAGRIELDARTALNEAGFTSVDYIVVADAETLQPLNCFDPNRPARVLAAAKLGKTRLIDNIPVTEA